MNKSFKSIWNESLGAWVAASEITSGRGKRSKSAVALATAAMLLASAGLESAHAQVLGGSGAKAVAPAIAAGENANAGGLKSVAIGAQTAAKTLNSVAIGPDATVNPVPADTAPPAPGTVLSGGVAIGANASSVDDSVAIGHSAFTKRVSSVALGSNAQTTGDFAVAFGAFTNAQGYNSTAFGGNAHAYSTDDIAIGASAQANGTSKNPTVDASGDAIAIGTMSKATGPNTIAVGYQASADDDFSTAIGSFAEARSRHSIALGSVAIARKEGDTAIGRRAQATGTGDASAVSLGRESSAFGGGATAIGHKSTAAGSGAFVGGRGNIASGDGTVTNATVVTTPATKTAEAFDTEATNTADGAVAIGNGNIAAGQGSVALGNRSNAGTAGSLAMGDTATVATKASRGVALGSGTTANNAGDVALGSGAVTDVAHATAGAKIAGKEFTFAGAAPASVVSVGAAGAERQITNVAAGQLLNNSTDAVNGSQLLATNEALNALNEGAVRYNKDAATGAPDKSSVTLGGTASADGGKTGGTKLTNVAQGALNDKSTDAVNGAQLNATNTNASAFLGGGADVASGKAPKYDVADGSFNDVGGALSAVDKVVNKGWNLSANSEATPQKIAPGGTVNFVNGSNTTVTRDGNKITVDVSKTPTFQSVTATSGTPGGGRATLGSNGLTTIGADGKAGAALGSNGLTTVGTDGKAGPGVTSAGIDAGGKPITNVGDGSVAAGSKDAVNGGQLDALAGSSVQYDKKADGTPDKSSVTLGAVRTDGKATTPVKLGNVADGTAPNDAVNRGQLDTVSATASLGWKLSANGEGAATAQKIAPGGTVDFINGSNTTVTRDGSKIKVDVTKTPTFDSVTVGSGVAGTPGTGSATLGANGLTTVGTDGKAGPSVTVAGIDAGGKALTNVGAGTKDTDAANVGQVKLAQAQAGNALQYDPKVGPDGKLALDKDGKPVPGKESVTLGGLGADGMRATAPVKLGNVADGVAPNDAVNRGQLDTVSTTASLGWNLSANGVNPVKIAPGDVVDFAGGSNTTVTRDNKKITVAVSKTPTFESVTVGTGVAGTPGTGSAMLGANGLTTIGTDGNAGPGITTAGIDAGGKPIANVGAGTADTDAANMGQVKFAQAQAGNALQYDPKEDGKPGKDSATLGGTASTDGGKNGGTKLTNVAQGALNPTSTDAVNGSQLNATNTNANAFLGGGADVANGTAPKYDVANGSFNNVGGALSAVDAVANKGWNLSANGVDPLKIAPGDAVNFVNGSNTTVTRDGNKITVDVSRTPTFDSVTVGAGVAGTPGTGSATLGANGLTTVGADGKPGPSVTSAGIDAGGKALTNVGAGTKDTDAANVGQVKIAQAQAGNAVQYDPTVGPDGKLVLDKDGKPVPGKDSATLGGTASTDGGKTGGTKLTNVAQGALNPTSTDAVNGAQLNTTNTNASAFLGGGADVANGTAPKYDVADGSFNDVGGALSAVDKVAKKGWNLSANGVDPLKIAPGDAVNFVNGSNTTVSRTGNKITVDVSRTPTFDSVTATTGTPGAPGSSSATLGSNGLTTSATGADGKTVAGPSVTTAGIDAGGKALTNVGPGTKDTDAANVGQVKLAQAQAGNSVQYDGTDRSAVTLGGTASTDGGKTGGTKLTNVAQGALSPTSTDTVNGAQLNTTNTNANAFLGGGADVANGKAPKYDLANGSFNNVGSALSEVDKIANKGWNLSANSEGATTAQKIAPGGTVDFVNGSNTTVTRDGSKITVDVSKTPIFDSVTATNGTPGKPGASATLGANGLTTIGTDGKAGAALGSNGLTTVGADGKPGASVTSAGIDAGGKALTNVGAGTADTDAANVGQVKLAQAQAGNALQYDPKVGPDGKLVLDKDGKPVPGKDSATLGGTASTDGGKNGGTKLTNVAQGALNPTSTDAVNGAQLNTTNTNASAFLGGGADVANGKAPKYDLATGSFNDVGSALSEVDKVANKGWNLSANGEATPQKITPGGTVDFIAGSNTTVSRDGSKIKVDVSKTPTFDSVTVGTGVAGTPGTGSATLGANGLTTIGTDGKAGAALGSNGLTTVGADGKAGPSVTSAGIDAGGKALTNVGAGTADTDAANVGQVKLAQAQAGNALQYDPKVNPDGKLALDPDGKPVPAKDSVTLGGVGADGKTPATGPVKLANVADGKLEAGSKDAVNGGQLFAVNEIANKGWNLSANSEATPQNIAPGGTVDFINGSNTTVSRDGNKIKVDVSKTPTFESVTATNGTPDKPGASATLGANGLTTVGADGKAGPNVTSVGIDAGGKALTNVGPGTADSDAANVGQVNAVGAQAGNSLQYDPKVGPDGKLVLDKDGKPVPGKDSATLGGTASTDGGKTGGTKLTNVAQGALNPTSTDAVNGAQLNTTNTNASAFLGGGADVANGTAPKYDVADGSFNDVGSALSAVDKVANKGWNLSANSEATPQKIAPGGVVDFINGSNTTVTRTDNKIRVDVSKTPTFDSVTVGTGVAGTPGTGSATLGANGLTTVGADGKPGASVTSAGIDAGGKALTNVGPGTADSDAANVAQVNAVGAKADNSLQYDPKVGPDGKLVLDKDGKPVPGKDSVTLGGVGADGKTPATGPVKLGNVADGNVAADSKDAVNGGQLNAVSETAGKGWDLSANSETTPQNIVPGGKVDFVNGSNTTVSRTGNQIKVDVSKTPTFDSVTVGTGVAGTPGSGSVTLGANGLTTIGTDGKAGPSVTSAGIDAGGKRLTNVGAGTDGTDAANVAQVNAVGAKADNSLQYDPKVEKDGKPVLDKDGKPVPGKDSVTLGGVGTDGKPATAPVKLGNVADGKVEKDSKDAVNGGQLNALGTGFGNVLGGTYANGVYTPPTYITVGGGTATTVQGALNNLGNAVSSGSVGPVQRTGSDGQLALVAPGATGAAPGAAQQLTNVKAGTVSGTSTDAVNGSQLHAVNEAVAAVGAKADNGLQYDPKDGKPGKDSVTLGGVGADGKPATAPVKLGNVADGNLAEGSRDAVNGGQLFTTNQNVTNLGNELKNLSTNINDGKVGPLQRTGNTDALVLVGKDGTAANPGAAQRVSNVANGTGAGDAVNFGQLTDVAKTANNSLQYDGADKSVATMGGTRSTDGGKTGGTKVTNVAQGALNDASTDAVNGAQLHAANTAMSNALGGGANLNEGKAPSYTVQGKTHDNVGGALGSVNENLTTVNQAINGGGIKYFRANSTLPDAVAGGTDAVAVGPNASASATASVAVGSGAKASAVNGTAVGFNAVVQQAGGVALGSGSVASTAAGVAGHVQDGAGTQEAAAVRATTGTLGAVSVGDAANGQYRQITGVAAGSADSDAANVAQLKASASAAKAGSAQYDTHPDGSTNYGQMTLGNGQAPGGTRISNVAPGVLPTDAANVGQLTSVQSQLQGQINNTQRIAYSGIAMATAMTSLPQATTPGKSVLSMGVGHYAGYSAVAIGYSQRSQDGSWTYKVNGSFGAAQKLNLGVGVGYEW